MAKHTHEVTISVTTRNIEDDEPHQEVMVIQRTESSEANTRIQQGVTKALTELFLGLGEEKLKGEPERGVIR